MNRLLLVSAALTLSARPASAPARTAGIVVGRNVHVSVAHPADTHYEVLAAADPRDPSHLIVGSILYGANDNFNSSIVYASRDGGLTWRPTLEGRTLENTGDPAVAFGPDGSAYYAASLIPAAGDRTMLFYRSPDGGATWDARSQLTYTDREYVTVDVSGGRFNGRIYVNGNNRVPRNVADFVVFRSADGGRTFAGPGKRAAFGTVQVPQMGNAVVASDGTLIGVFTEVRAGAPAVVLSATTSTDGGESLTTAATIGTIEPGGNRKGTDNNVNSEPVVAIDASRTRFRDNLYVAWPDRRSGHSQVFFSASADLGKTWSAPRAINDNARTDTTDQLMPTVAVNRAGAVGVMWYDRRNHPDNLGWDVRFAASVDGGATFGPSAQVSERGTDFGPATPWTALRATSGKARDGLSLNVSLNTFTFMGGDTAGLVADATGVFHAVWVDNRTGVPQVWTASVTVAEVGPANRPQSTQNTQVGSGAGPGVSASPETRPVATDTRRRPGADAGGGTDVTDQLALVVTRTAYDRSSETLTITAHLENTSASVVTGALRLRATAFAAELGDPVAANSDNGSAGPGAEWEFGNSKLLPARASESRELRFTLRNLRPFRSGHRSRLGVLELTARVFGAVQAPNER